MTHSQRGDEDYIQEMDDLPTGVNKEEVPIKNDPMEVPPVDTSQFVEVVQKACAYLFTYTKMSQHACAYKAASPLVSLACSLYTLFCAINSGVWKWYDYVIHVTSMVSQMIIVLNSFWEISKYTTIATAMMKSCIAALRNITCSIGAICSVAIQFTTALGAGALVASGFLPSVTKIGSAVLAIKYTGEYMTDIIKSLGQVVRFDLTD